MSDEAPAISPPPSSMKRRAGILLASVVLLFTLVVVDVSRELTLLSDIAGWVVFGFAALLLVLAVSLRSLPNRTVALLLLLGALGTLGLRSVGLGRAVARSPEQWRIIQDETGRRLAAVASERFTELCSRVRAAARDLARSSAVALAVEGSDAHDYVSRAFEELARADLPRAHPRGVPGATLFDGGRSPVAWAGANASPRVGVSAAGRCPAVRDVRRPARGAHSLGRDRAPPQQARLCFRRSSTVGGARHRESLSRRLQRPDILGRARFRDYLHYVRRSGCRDPRFVRSPWRSLLVRDG